MPGRILFIDDDPAGREVALFNLRKAGYETIPAADGREGLSLFSASPFDLVITDLKMPGISGMEVLRKVRAGSPDVPVLVITAFGNVETAVAGMKEGAYDFIGKPFHRDQLLLAVSKALERRRLATEVRNLRIRAAGVGRDVVSVSQAMRRLLEVADRVAATSATVLITGESGTGKEVLARRIHVRPRRAVPPGIGRDAVPRRGGGNPAGVAGEAAARAPGKGGGRGGRGRAGAGGRPHPCGDEPRPARPHPGGGVPGGPVLPAERRGTRRPAVAGAPGRHPPVGAPVRRRIRRRPRDRGSPRRGRGAIEEAVARQRAGAEERVRADGHPVPRRRGFPRRSSIRAARGGGGGGGKRGRGMASPSGRGSLPRGSREAGDRAGASDEGGEHHASGDVPADPPAHPRLPDREIRAPPRCMKTRCPASYRACGRIFGRSFPRGCCSPRGSPAS